MLIGTSYPALSYCSLLLNLGGGVRVKKAAICSVTTGCRFFLSPYLHTSHSFHFPLWPQERRQFDLFPSSLRQSSSGRRRPATCHFLLHLLSLVNLLATPGCPPQRGRAPAPAAGCTPRARTSAGEPGGQRQPPDERAGWRRAQRR